MKKLKNFFTRALLSAFFVFAFGVVGFGQTVLFTSGTHQLSQYGEEFILQEKGEFGSVEVVDKMAKRADGSFLGEKFIVKVDDGGSVALVDKDNKLISLMGRPDAATTTDDDGDSSSSDGDDGLKISFGGLGKVLKKDTSRVKKPKKKNRFATTDTLSKKWYKRFFGSADLDYTVQVGINGLSGGKPYLRLEGGYQFDPMFSLGLGYHADPWSKQIRFKVYTFNNNLYLFAGTNSQSEAWGYGLGGTTPVFDIGSADLSFSLEGLRTVRTEETLISITERPIYTTRFAVNGSFKKFNKLVTSIGIMANAVTQQGSENWEVNPYLSVKYFFGRKYRRSTWFLRN